MEEAVLWGLVIIGGPLLLFLALNWAKFKSAKANREIDPARSGSDPSKGMHPSDRAQPR